MSFAGDPSARRISEPQIAPTLNIDLPGRWFLTFYPSYDIRINFGAPKAGQTGRRRKHLWRSSSRRSRTSAPPKAIKLQRRPDYGSDVQATVRLRTARGMPAGKWRHGVHPIAVRNTTCRPLERYADPRLRLEVVTGYSLIMGTPTSREISRLSVNFTPARASKGRKSHLTAVSTTHYASKPYVAHGRVNRLRMAGRRAVAAAVGLLHRGASRPLRPCEES
jgi:hypothetical protein